MDGSWGGYGCVDGCPMHVCTCMLNMLNMDASMSVAICHFYTCIHVSVGMCMHVHVC